MQNTLKIILLAGLTLTSLMSVAADASTVVFTASRVVQLHDGYNAFGEKLVNAPIRLNSDQKVLLIPKSATCPGDVCIESLQFNKLQLVQFQKVAGNVTRAKAVGKIVLSNGMNNVQVEIQGNTNQSARMIISAVAADGTKMQATLDGNFMQSAF